MMLESTLPVLLALLAASAIAFCSKKKCIRPPPSSEITSSNKSAVSTLRPKAIPLTPKEQMIAQGLLKRGKHDYPTMDDVVSDWSSSGEGECDAKSIKVTQKKQNSKQVLAVDSKKTSKSKEVVPKSHSVEPID